ncbi:hypothetical protein M9H77_27701 [Catharanthus roseus]|uniref:Uncharacterized protein n=1 Tax=Catharanthus roseus TaxID=4058 RepID=A0ACC0AFZ9_CATRO|nr:hypothetical protein M9H77_27701 [Catharanthus roseus]
MDAHNFQPLHGCIPAIKNPLDGKFSNIPCPLVSTASLKQYLHFLNDVRNRYLRIYSRPTLIEYLRTALTACTLSTNLMPNCMSVMESFQSSNQTVPDSTRSFIGEPEPISRNAPECV